MPHRSPAAMVTRKSDPAGPPVLIGDDAGVAFGSRQRILIGGCAALVMVSGGGALALLGKSGRWLDQGDKLASVLGAVIGLAGLVIAIWSLRATLRTGAEDPIAVLDRACGEPARVVARQREHEAFVRGLRRPEPSRVRWSTTGRPVTPTPNRHRSTTLRSRTGDITGIAAAWRGLPARQLVIIGSPGAGKTSILVLLIGQLLVGWRNPQPVPVRRLLLLWIGAGLLSGVVAAVAVDGLNPGTRLVIGPLLGVVAVLAAWLGRSCVIALDRAGHLRWGGGRNRRLAWVRLTHRRGRRSCVSTADRAGSRCADLVCRPGPASKTGGSATRTSSRSSDHRRRRAGDGDGLWRRGWHRGRDQWHRSGHRRRHCGRSDSGSHKRRHAQQLARLPDYSMLVRRAGPTAVAVGCLLCGRTPSWRASPGWRRMAVSACEHSGSPRSTAGRSGHAAWFWGVGSVPPGGILRRMEPVRTGTQPED